MTIDASGTCHQVGCPGKGQHPPHGIGAGSWDDYTQPAHCLGYPKVSAGFELIQIECSLDGPWNAAPRLTLCPADMAQLVDQHKAECTNRTARPTPTTGATA